MPVEICTKWMHERHFQPVLQVLTDMDRNLGPHNNRCHTGVQKHTPMSPRPGGQWAKRGVSGLVVPHRNVTIQSSINALLPSLHPSLPPCSSKNRTALWTIHLSCGRKGAHMARYLVARFDFVINNQQLNDWLSARGANYCTRCL